MLATPISLASDHLETLVEIDIQTRRVATSAGIRQFEVTRGLNDSPAFLSMLAGLLVDRASKPPGR